MHIHVETEHLKLREAVEADIDDLLELDSDPEVMHFITGGLPTPREEMVNRILPGWFEYYQQGAGLGYWVAEQKMTGEFLGWFHLRPGEGHGPEEPELGYRLRRSAWGKGYATEGCRALMDKAFHEQGVERILAETMAVNHASRRVMEKSGMRFLRLFHADWPYPIPGDEHGDVEYVIERRDWEDTRGQSVVGDVR